MLFATSAEADAVVDGPVGTKLHASLADKGIIALGYWELSRAMVGATPAGRSVSSMSGESC